MELATIMAFSLSWWNYPLIALVTFGSVWLAYRLENWRESKADPGPYPCLTHLGRCEAGWDIWCWKQAGHDDSHDHPHLYTECTEVSREWAGVESCGHWESNLYCASVHGHDGPHDLRTA